MQERQPVSPPSPSASYEEIGDRDSVDSLTPLHSVSSWLNIPAAGESGETTNWVEQSYPRRSEYFSSFTLFIFILSLSLSLSLSLHTL